MTQEKNLEVGQLAAVFLTDEELLKLQKVKLPSESLEQVRDLFMFQALTGLFFVDLEAFDYKKIQEVAGKQVYATVSLKTRAALSIPLPDSALQILKKYGERLPKIDHTKYNADLQVVADLAKIGKPLNSHVARHTAAKLFLNVNRKIGNDKRQ